jgi:neutral ceramidase
MNLGTSQLDITPQPGVELSGFAARIQPSNGVLDPLFAKALYLLNGETRLLWIHCDLVGFDRSIVLAFRRWAQEQLRLSPGEVMLSATHTHSGACTIHLQEAGRYDPAYVEWLQQRLRLVAQDAVARTDPVDCISVEGRLDLTLDRRKTASAHTDPRVAAVGFRRPDHTFAAVLVNYPMHPVALGSSNRRISADIPGRTALSLAAQLPGHPIVCVTNGACANLNPPAENVSVDQIAAWGKQIADAVAAPLQSARPPFPPARLRVIARIIPLPMDTLDAPGINAFADRALRDTKSLAEWGEKYRRVVEHWRSSLLAGLHNGKNASHRDAELFGVGIGDVVLLGANAEVFSEFTDWLRPASDKRVYLVGYANGDLGYLPTRAAYAEGGYEVEVAHLFYGGFRPQPGGLELLAREATDLLRAL